MDIGELRKKALEFERRVRNRNWREYGAALLVAVACVWMLVAAPRWHVKAGAALSMVGIAAVCWNLYRKGSAEVLPDGAVVSRDWYRKELERQRDLLRDVWKWYLGPMVPGMVMWFGGGLLEHPERWRVTAVTFGIGVAVFVVVGRLNTQAARRLDKEINSL